MNTPRSTGERIAVKAEGVAETNRKLLLWLVPVLVLLGVGVIGLLFIVQGLMQTVDHLDTKTGHIDVQVSKVGAYVDELQAPPSADEARRNAAVSTAVELVPEIKGILCEQFPQASACRK